MHISLYCQLVIDTSHTHKTHTMENKDEKHQESELTDELKKTHTMNIENTASQMRKGVLEFCVLSVIKKGEVYPSDIIEKMKTAGFQLLEGTLYPLLTRLKNAGMVNYRWVESQSGPPRKYFSLTDEGLSFITELELTWGEMANSVKIITEG